MDNTAIASYNNSALPNALTTYDVFTDPNVYKTCEFLARSNYVPDSYKGKPEDVMAALLISITHHMDAFTVMQNLQMVKGNARWKSDYTIGAINSSGLYAGNLKFEIKYNDAGDAVDCTAWAIEKATGEKVVGSPITWDMVVNEGWNKDSTTKSGYVQKSKWNTMREQMFRYRAAVFFARTNCPEVLMGYYTADEDDDIATNQALQYEDKTAPAPAPAEPETPKQPSPKMRLPKQPSPKMRLWNAVLEQVEGDKAKAADICKAVVGGQTVTEDNLGRMIVEASKIGITDDITESASKSETEPEEVPEHLREEPF